MCAYSVVNAVEPLEVDFHTDTAVCLSAPVCVDSHYCPQVTREPAFRLRSGHDNQEASHACTWR